MFHVMCASLVLVAALAETSMMRQWARQHELPGIQQAAAAAAFQSGQARN